MREDALRFLHSIKDDESHPLLRDGYVFNLVVEHEYQHQETLAYLLQLLAPELKAGCRIQDSGFSFAIESGHPSLNHRTTCEPPSTLNPESRILYPDMITIPGGRFEMGARGYPFAYDNEQPPHVIELDSFRIDRYPVTNGEYAAFIAAGGYATRSLWSDAGWEWKEKNAIQAPLYWSRSTNDEPWRVREMFDEVELHDERLSTWEAEIRLKTGPKRGRRSASVDAAAAVLRLQGGPLAVLTGTRRDPLGYDVRLEVFGTEDSIAVGADRRTPLRSVEPGGHGPSPDGYHDFLDRFGAAYRAELEAFVTTLSEGGPSLCPLAEARAALAVALAADRSRAERRPVSIEEVASAQAVAG